MQDRGLPGFYDRSAFSQDEARRRGSHPHPQHLEFQEELSRSAPANYLSHHSAHPTFHDASRHSSVALPLGHRPYHPPYYASPTLPEFHRLFDPRRQSAPEIYRGEAVDASAAEWESVATNQVVPVSMPIESRCHPSSMAAELASISYAYYGTPPPSSVRGSPHFSDSSVFPAPSHDVHSFRDPSSQSRPASSGSYYSDFADHHRKHRGSVSSHRGSEREMVSPYPRRERGSTSSSIEEYPLPAVDTASAAARPFQCDVCQLSFQRNHDLKRHKRIHLEVKPFPCPGCPKRFTRRDALKRHLLVKQHPGVSPEGEYKEAVAGAKEEFISSSPSQNQQRPTTIPIDPRQPLHWSPNVQLASEPLPAEYFPAIPSTASYPPVLQPSHLPPSVRIPLPYDHPSPTDSSASPTATPTASNASHEIWPSQALPQASANHPPANYAPNHPHSSYS